MKTPFVTSIALVGAFALAACGGGKSPAENSAEQLDNAAGQSTPAAAAALNDAAEQIRDRNISDPNAAQAAMQAAGNVQAGQGPMAPRQAGARPHRPGDPVPPPKLAPGQGMVGNSGSNNPAAGTGNH
jgi:hypothetical protein